MEFRKIEKTGKTIEDAKNNALDEFLSIYKDADKSDLKIIVVQEPVRRLFKTKPAIVQVSFTENYILREKAHEEQLRIEREQKEKEEREKREKEEREQEEKLKIEQENREKEEWQKRYKKLNTKIKMLSKNFPSLLYNFITILQIPIKYLSQCNINIKPEDLTLDLFSSFELLNNSSADDPTGNFDAFQNVFFNIWDKYIGDDLNPWGKPEHYVAKNLSETLFNEDMDLRSNVYVALVTNSDKDFSLDSDNGFAELYKEYDKESFILNMTFMYIKYILCLVILFNDFENAQKISKNEEFSQIILNYQEGHILIDEKSDEMRYELYIQYYKDIFGEKTLSESIFRNAANVFLLMDAYKDAFDYFSNSMSLINLSPNDIVKNSFDSNPDIPFFENFSIKILGCGGFLQIL